LSRTGRWARSHYDLGLLGLLGLLWPLRLLWHRWNGLRRRLRPVAASWAASLRRRSATDVVVCDALAAMAALGIRDRLVIAVVLGVFGDDVPGVDEAGEIA